MDTATLPRHAYHHLMYTLRKNLPPAPPDPVAALARDYAAIAQVSSLCPANAAEAAIAAQAVAANAQAMETMGLANDPATEPHRVPQCVAQVASMMRQAQGALRVLLAMQAERRRREADPVAANGSAWIEHGAAQWMAEALPARPGLGATVSCSDPIDQNTGYCSHIHVHETESADHPDLLPDPGTAGLSQNMVHTLVPQSHETNSDKRFDASPEVGVAEKYHFVRLCLTPQSHETNPGSPSRDVEGGRPSHDAKHILMSQVHETDSVIAPPPPAVTDRDPAPLRVPADCGAVRVLVAGATAGDNAERAVRPRSPDPHGPNPGSASEPSGRRSVVGRRASS